jgi:hypothetical protein
MLGWQRNTVEVMSGKYPGVDGKSMVRFQDSHREQARSHT